MKDPHPISESLPPESSKSDRMAVAPIAGRSPLSSARCCLTRTLGTMMAIGMLVLLSVLGVRAFSGRHGCTSGSGLWTSYFGGRHAAGDAGKCLVRAATAEVTNSCESNSCTTGTTVPVLVVAFDELLEEQRERISVRFSKTRPRHRCRLDRRKWPSPSAMRPLG